MSDTSETAHCSFGVYSFYRKDFQMLLAVNEGEI